MKRIYKIDSIFEGEHDYYDQDGNYLGYDSPSIGGWNVLHDSFGNDIGAAFDGWMDDTKDIFMNDGTTGFEHKDIFGNDVFEFDNGKQFFDGGDWLNDF